MRIYTKLFIAGAILFALAIITIPDIMVFSMFCFMAGFILLIVKNIDTHANNTSPRTGTGQNDYTYNYDSFTQKQRKDEKPPWEE